MVYFPLALQGSIQGDYVSRTRREMVTISTIETHLKQNVPFGSTTETFGKNAHATMKKNLIRASRTMNVQCVTLSQLVSSSK